MSVCVCFSVCLCPPSCFFLSGVVVLFVSLCILRLKENDKTNICKLEPRPGGWLEVGDGESCIFSLHFLF